MNNSLFKIFMRPFKVILFSHRFRKKNRHNNINITGYHGPWKDESSENNVKELINNISIERSK